MRKSAVIALGLVLAGCGGEAVDLGDDGEQPSLEGQWVGSLRSNLFVGCEPDCPPPEEWPIPRTLRLTLDGTGRGSLLVGDAALPLPTDPSVGYPPEAQADAYGLGMGVHLYDGITYPLLEVSVSGNDMHFELEAVGAFDSFCALQTPIVDDSPGPYRCGEPAAFGLKEDENGQMYCVYQTDAEPDQDIEVDCVVLKMCAISTSPRCVCTSSECTAGAPSGPDSTISFDLALNDAHSALAGNYAFWDEDPAWGVDVPAQIVEFRRQ